MGQSVLDRKIDFQATNIPVSDALISICEKADINVSFDSRLLADAPTITLQYKNKALKSLLTACLKETEIGFKWNENRLVLYQKPPPIYTISGFVEDSLSGERLVSATVFDYISGKGTTTNEYGFYSLSIPRGKASLGFSYLGFNSRTYQINIRKNLYFNVPLKSAITLKEIVVTDNRIDLKDGLSVTDAPNYTMDALRKMPATGGEPDIIKFFQTLPGVESGSGSLGGTHVRGGDANHNLVLLDGVPVYNPSHSLGLFSIFNENIVKSARLYKGKFPAKYGGRLASVIDIQTKEGNDKKFQFDVGTSLFATNATVEGPIKKDKTSFLLSGRRTHLEPVFNSIYVETHNDSLGNTGQLNYFFYDFNAKINHTLSEKDKLYVSFYRGSDQLKYLEYNYEIIPLVEMEEEGMEGIEEFNTKLTGRGSSLNISWGNTILSSRWNRVWNNKLFSNLTLTYSEFAFRFLTTSSEEFENEEREFSEFEQFDFSSRIQDVALKMDFDYIKNNKHYFKFGLGIKERIFAPILRYNEFELEETGVSIDDEVAIDSVNVNSTLYFATEFNFYFEDEWKITDKLSAQLGFHNALFTASNKAWNAFQPRLSIQYDWLPSSKIYASYNQMSQFLHILSPVGISMPFDLWVPSTNNVGPQRSRQILIGTEWRLPADFTFGAELYYKKLDNLITYRQGFNDFFTNSNNDFEWEEQITSGQGWNYGMETSLTRNKGKMTGYLNYTWSKAERQFEGLSSDQRFPFRFNREHVFKVGINHEFSPKFSLFSAWYYGSGQFTTPRVIEFYGDGDNIDALKFDLNNDATELNNTQLFPHHKLDISFNFHWPKKRVEHFFTFSINNLYSNRNPLFSVRYEDVDNPGEMLQEDVPGLPMMPGLRYAIKF